MEFERLSPCLERRYASGERVTLAHFRLREGCVVRRHSHPNEQVSYVLSGLLEFDVGGRKFTASPGQFVVIPPGVEHEVRALADSEVVDGFSPPRDDWRAGRDDYLRKA